MSDEKRTAQRLLVNLTARWDGASSTVARIEDISVKGCFVNTLGTAIVGESIRLEIKTPSGEWMSVSGRVSSFMQGMGFGVLFTFATVEEQLALRQLISTLTIASLDSEERPAPEPNPHE